MTLAIDEVHIAYCREARRLRSVHAGRPGRKLRAIADLSDQYDTRRRASSISASPGATSRRYAADLCSPPTPPTARVSEHRDQWHPTAAATRVTVRAVADSPRAIFAEKVAAELAGDVLTYSHRQALLAEASRLGVGRFEANLVIAEALHDSPRSAPENDQRTRLSLIALIGLALFMESIAALVIYRLLM